MPTLRPSSGARRGCYVVGMRFQHDDVTIDVDPCAAGPVAEVRIEQDNCESFDVVNMSFTTREWRALSRHVEEAIREAALLRRRAKSAERRKRDAMKGTR